MIVLYAISRNRGNSKRLSCRNPADTSEQDGIRCTKIKPERFLLVVNHCSFSAAAHVTREVVRRQRRHFVFVYM